MNRNDSRDVVAVLPPTTAECMSVSITRVNDWLVKEIGDTDLNDVLGVAKQPEEDSKDQRPGGPGTPVEASRSSGAGPRKGGLLQSLGDLRNLRPGDTLVLPLADEGWNELGHIPDPTPPKETSADRSKSSESAPREESGPSKTPRGKGISIPPVTNAC